METSQKSTSTNFRTSTAWWVDSLVKHLASPVGDVASRIPEGRFFLTLPEYLGLSPQDYLYSRMCEDSLVTTTEALSKPSSLRLMIWGTTVNGKCLTAKITEYRNIGNVSSLSAILEEHPDQKYFLSDSKASQLRISVDERGFPMAHIPEATKKGYATATVGQAMNLGQLNSKTRRGRVSNVSPTLDTGMQIHTLTDEGKVRRLTPVECERLQAFPDDWTKFGENDEPISNTQRYKMCGNAVTTFVFKDIFERILDTAAA